MEEWKLIWGIQERKWAESPNCLGRDDLSQQSLCGALGLTPFTSSSQPFNTVRHKYDPPIPQ
jgi:hypothetical protein